MTSAVNLPTIVVLMDQEKFGLRYVDEECGGLYVIVICGGATTRVAWGQEFVECACSRLGRPRGSQHYFSVVCHRL